MKISAKRRTSHRPLEANDGAITLSKQAHSSTTIEDLSLSRFERPAPSRSKVSLAQAPCHRQTQTKAGTKSALVAKKQKSRFGVKKAIVGIMTAVMLVNSVLPVSQEQAYNIPVPPSYSQSAEIKQNVHFNKLNIRFAESDRVKPPSENMVDVQSRDSQANHNQDLSDEAHHAFTSSISSNPNRHRRDPSPEPGLSRKEIREALKRGANKHEYVERTRANNAINELEAPKNIYHPYVQHLSKVRGQLESAGLPTSAEGVRVHVMDPTSTHGAAVTRVISGAVGLAQGADVRLASHKLSTNGEPISRLLKRGSDFLFVPDTIDGFAKAALSGMEWIVHQKRSDLKYVMKQLEGDQSKTTLVNFSYGTNPARLARLGAELIAQSGSQKLKQKFADVVGKKHQDLTKADYMLVIAERVHERMKTPKASNFFDTLGKYENDLKNALERGVLVVESAGNEFGVINSKYELSRSAADTATSSVHVGATYLPIRRFNAQGELPSLPFMSYFSSHGAEVSAPGVDIPVGKSGSSSTPLEIDGTSFASPYVVSVAALMIAANPTITAVQIKSILSNPAASIDIEGTTRDGVGMLQPVRAVQMARDLLVGGGETPITP